MNEDYVGRMFARNRRMKFSTFFIGAADLSGSENDTV